MVLAAPVAVLVVLQLTLGAAAHPLSPDTVVPLSVAHWTWWRRRGSRSGGAAGRSAASASSSSYNLRLGGAHGFLTDDPGSQRSVARVSKVVLAGQALDKQQQFTHREGSGRSAKKLSVALSVPPWPPVPAAFNKGV